jgi:hypothetical protein
MEVSVMKLLIGLFLAIVLSACSSTASKMPASGPEKAEKPEASASQLAESSFQESNGTLTVMFDAKGNWVRLTAVGAASLTDDSPGAIETALMIAGMRAKRTVAEFIQSDVRSSKALTRIARSYDRAFQSSESQGAGGGIEDAQEPQEAEDDGGVGGGSAGANALRIEKARQARRVATVLTERIHESSSAILKGVQVSRRSVDGDSVRVEVSVSPGSIGTARQVSRMMSGVMK